MNGRPVRAATHGVVVEAFSCDAAVVEVFIRDVVDRLVSAFFPAARRPVVVLNPAYPWRAAAQLREGGAMRPRLVAEQVTAWGQRAEPPPWTFLAESDGYWRCLDAAAAHDRTGVYLGDGLVLVEDGPRPPGQRPAGHLRVWFGDTLLMVPHYDAGIRQERDRDPPAWPLGGADAGQHAGPPAEKTS